MKLKKKYKYMLIGLGGVLFILIMIYMIFLLMLRPVNNNKSVNFKIDSGTSSIEIIDTLKKENLIRSSLISKIYLKVFTNYSLKAGTYVINSNLSTKEIFKLIDSGKSIENKGITITFVEGKRFSYYIKLICDKYSFIYDDVIEELSDKEYLRELIDKYYFISDDVLNDELYYPLEGYLFPDTYNFKTDADIKTIIEKMLDNMGNKLMDYDEDIKNSGYSYHDILTMASIIELEGINKDDRYKISGILFNRIKKGYSLGSDVTTYYAAKVEVGERDLYKNELDDCNSYNTRSTCLIGLPAGPIDSPSLISISAALKPEMTDYLYFVADKYGKTYFSKSYLEHQKTIMYLNNNNLWYNY